MPDVVRELLFPDFNNASLSDGESDHRPRKRRKTDVDEESVSSFRGTGKPDALSTKEIILENDVDRYLVSALEMEGNDAGQGRRYKISLFPRKHSGEGEQQSGCTTTNGVAPKKSPVNGEEQDLTPVEESQARLAKLALSLGTDVDMPHQQESCVEGEANASSASDAAASGLTSSQEVLHLKQREQSRHDDAAPTPTVPIPNPETHQVEAPLKAPLHDIASDVCEGDVLFLTSGIRIARGKIVGQPPSPGAGGGGGGGGGGAGACSKLDWFMEVTRWKWGERPPPPGEKEKS